MATREELLKRKAMVERKLEIERQIAAQPSKTRPTGIPKLTETSDKFKVQLPQDVKNIKKWAMMGGDSKEVKARLTIYEKVRDDYLKTGAISPEVERVKIGIVNALLPQLGRLQQIETTSPVLSLANWAVQGLGDMANVNPELSSYKTAASGIKIPVLKGLLGEKGASAEREQESAQEISMPTGKEMFSAAGRAEGMENIFTTILGTSGVDIRPHLEKTAPELLAAMGAFPTGSKGSLPSRGIMSGDQLDEIIEKEITGPQVGFTGQPTGKNYFKQRDQAQAQAAAAGGITPRQKEIMELKKQIAAEAAKVAQ